MAYFNPQKVDFNPNTNMIDAVGAVGKSLYEIYKDNMLKNQNQMKINEGIRHNKAVEQHNADVLGETKEHHAWQRADSEKKFNADQEWRTKEFNFGLDKFNAERDFKNKQHTDNIFYKKLILQDRLDAKAERQWEKEIALTTKMQAQDDELTALAGQYIDDPYVAGHFKALDKDGNINQEALVEAIKTTYKANPKAAVSGMNKILSEKKAFDANNAQSQAIKIAATLNGQLQQIPNGKRLDNYDGWGDRIGDFFNAAKGDGVDKKAVEGILAILNNAGYQMVKTGKGAEGERKDFDKEYKITLDSAIFDNDKFSKAQKLQNLTMPSLLKELELKRDSVSNQYAKNYYQKQIDDLNAINSRLEKFFNAKPNPNITPANIKKEVDYAE